MQMHVETHSKLKLRAHSSRLKISHVLYNIFSIIFPYLAQKKKLTFFFWMICLLAWRFAGDMWSAGLILYAMCFGDLPYHSEDPAECRRQVVSHKASVTGARSPPPGPPQSHREPLNPYVDILDLYN